MEKNKYIDYGNELRFFYCPICKKYDENNPDFSVNKKTGAYMCHKSGKGGNIKDLEGFSLDPSTLENCVEDKQPKPDFKNIFMSKINDKLGNDWIEYLKGRGISSKYLDKFCRFHKEKNAMMIPITDGEKIVALKYRTIDKKLSSEKGSNTEYLLNWQHVKSGGEVLIITEGEIDLLSAIEVGFDNVVSLPFGAKNVKCINNQKDWIESFKKIIIATDNDEAGEDSKDLITKRLDNSKLYEIDLKGFKDLNEVLQKAGANTLREFLNNYTPIKGESNAPFVKKEDGYYTSAGKKVTSFTLNIKGFSNSYFIGEAINDGRVKEFIAPKTELLTKIGILKHLGYYLGSTQSISLFWCWIERENKNKFLKEIPHYGIIEGIYYDINSQAICSKQDLKITPLKDIENLTEEERAWASTNLVYMRNDTNQSLLGLCWAFGRFHIEETYPMLEVAGTTSIGKTEFVEFISRIMFGTKENIKSFTTLSNHQIRSLASCSNITPLAIDEIKITGKNLKDKADNLFSTLRAVFDNKTVNQGTIEEKLREFKLCTPLIISGESDFADVSMKNRMISTELTRLNKGNEEIYYKLKDTKILEKIGKAGLEKRLKEGVVTVTVEQARELLPTIKDTRQLEIGRCILTGLKALREIIEIDEKIVKKFISFLDAKLSSGYTVTSNFLELLDLVLNSERETFTYLRNIDGTYFTRFNILYKAIAEEHRKTNSTLELLDMRTLKKQLVEEGFIVKQRIPIRFPKDDFTNKTETYKAEEFIRF